MADRAKYAAVRQKIVEAIRTDLMGPQAEDEVLDEDPRFAYLVGMLDREESAAGSEQEIDTDASREGEEDFTAGEDDDNEPVSVTHFRLPSSLGISFYLAPGTEEIELEASWGDYAPSAQACKGKDGKTYQRAVYARHPQKETVSVALGTLRRSREYALSCDPGVCVHVSRIVLESGASLVTAHLVNRRPRPVHAVEGLLFQAGIRAYAPDGRAVFLAEHLCRTVTPEEAGEELYFSERPILGRGRGCAAVWAEPADGRTTCVASSFLPEYEYPGVSAAVDGFDAAYFSTAAMAAPARKGETLGKLEALADAYERWIAHTLEAHERMRDASFRAAVGGPAAAKCRTALRRMREGVALLKSDAAAFEAFCFMNRAIFLQNAIRRYAKTHGAGVACSFQDFANPKDAANTFGWRPFQIAFILMNLAGIANPRHPDREIVDLLYFPTGGGKTEAYLGLMAFVIACRRLHAADAADGYERDGGVTVILRYTLRLLTTQQRDRITRMILAAELLRRKQPERLGREPITIGFWVGGGVTPNKFSDFQENKWKPGAAAAARRQLCKQLLTCPFCGKPLAKDDFHIHAAKRSVEIYCSDKDCAFSKYGKDRIPLPVALVDEEIYAKCPTVLLSTVDKFARLPWDVQTNAIFGRVDRRCSRDGYVALGAEHAQRHRAAAGLPAARVEKVRPFLPPELIIQDELHLITGPLGTVYGAYETIIEKMCSYDGIRPKYVVSTATIKNAAAQAQSLYARKQTAQFPPNGLEIGDSFFIREVPVKENPFRKYVGVCAPGQSMKSAQLRLYAIILQTAYTLFLRKEWKDVIDPYYTLIGYFNSIRELGGAVRLRQDDIPKRILRIQKKYGQEKPRYLDDVRNIEITSRMSSYKIPEKLRQLETACDGDEARRCLDTAVATNMIAVGMDVDRLGLMAVHGQPKQNAEYIQATSRIGRAFPGLVVTLYNPYRPRDLSHYENFTGYHAQLYRFVEGTTATPFSARARDRVLHALVIAALRLSYPEMAENDGAAAIAALAPEKIQAVKRLILDRMEIVKPSARQEAEAEIDSFLDWWKLKAAQEKNLRYYVWKTGACSRLMNAYDQPHRDDEKATLNSMREVESAANMYYYVEE